MFVIETSHQDALKHAGSVEVCGLGVVTMLVVLCRVLLAVVRYSFDTDGYRCHRVVHPRRPHLVRLHVLLHVGFLGESSAADDTLEGFLTRVTVRRHTHTRNIKTQQTGPGSGFKSWCDDTTAEQMFLPPDVLLQVKIFTENFITEVTLQFLSFRFHLPC